MTGFWGFFTNLREAKFGFGVIWDFISSIYYSITANPDIAVVWDGLMSAIAPAKSLIMTLLVVFSVVIAIFGKRMIGFLKFVFFFVLGFALGTHLVASLLPPEVSIPAALIGLIIAVVAGVLYRFLYIILYCATVGYGAYILFYNGFYAAPASAYSNGKAVVCLVAAAVVLILALVFKRFIEMIGTAFLGGWLAGWLFANQIYNFTKWPVFAGNTTVAILIPAIIVALFGAFVQIKTRRRN